MMHTDDIVIPSFVVIFKSIYLLFHFILFYLLFHFISSYFILFRYFISFFYVIISFHFFFFGGGGRMGGLGPSTYSLSKLFPEDLIHKSKAVSS